MAKPKMVLVTDPDLNTRKHLVEILTEAGYKVGATDSPVAVKEALMVVPEVSLVITVLHFCGGVCPGILLVEWLRAAHPEIKILITTIMPDFAPKGVPVLRSPYTDEALLEAVQKELA